MRQLAAYASYHDNIGELVVGRARFYNIDGSPAEVFGLDNAYNNYVSLGSVVFTNSSGQLTPQVFLEDHDYLIMFDKYVGSGTLSEDDDSESWEEQGSAVDKFIPLVNGDSGLFRGISTIERLRQTDPTDDEEVLALLGYYEAGDKEPIFYKFDATSTTQDNGGSVIKVQERERGRWVLLQCPDPLDVRHFGAFPSSVVSDNVTQRYAIQKAGAYAHSNRCGLYFPAAEGSAIYFDVTGLELYDVDASPLARIYSYGSKTILRGIRNITCGGASSEGTIELRDDVLRTSFGGDYEHVQFTPGRKLIIDSEVLTDDEFKSFSGIEVEFDSWCGDGMEFDNCKIHSNKVIEGEITIRNCELHSSWFTDEYDWDDLTSEDNLILVNNCESAEIYIILKNKQNESDYGSLGNRSLTDATLLSGAIISDTRVDGVTLKGSATLDNVSGSIVISGSTAEVTLDRCDLELSGNTTLKKYIARYGSITLANDYTISVTNTLRLDSVDVNAKFSTIGISPEYTRCMIEKNQYNGKKVSYIGCIVNADIEQVPEYVTTNYRHEINGEFIENIFRDTHKISLNPKSGVDYSDDTVRIASSWLRNCSDHNFVDATGWSSTSVDEKLVSYMYKDNYGGCPQESIDYGRESIAYQCILQRKSNGQNPTETTNRLELPDDIIGSVRSGLGDTGFWMLRDIRGRDGIIGGDEDFNDAEISWILNVNAKAFNTASLFWLRGFKSSVECCLGVSIQATIDAYESGTPISDLDPPYKYGKFTHTFEYHEDITVSQNTYTLTFANPIRFPYSGCDQFGSGQVGSAINQAVCEFPSIFHIMGENPADDHDEPNPKWQAEWGFTLSVK